ncbi:MAG: carboxylesterase [Archangium gephyra]|uniref:Carboxylic ester hydrolase n=1 Tax=Archangium gephyra TaxID=48 RepID=A0A2W5T4T1_9BACT|nr:MAG: carboxylesterase [Archangium gephyra]
MRSSLLVLLVVSGCATTRGIAPWTEVKGAPADATVRTTAQGELVGFVERKGNHAWLGIPYAAKPERWRAPKPAEPWSGRREATRYGALCPQLNGPLGGAKDTGVVAGSEDCLTLSIFAPALTADEARSAKRPVMFWIHGGGNTIGTGNVYGFARNLALKHGVIIVNVNYRLGVLGWFHHPALLGPELSPEDASGNYGTLDLIAALKWVNQNIEAFGGDPANVTVFGESAGGFNTFSLLASPLAHGLFHRAAIQSGVPGSVGLQQAWHYVDDAQPGVKGSSSEVLVAQVLLDGKAKTREDAKQVISGMSADQLAAYLRGRTPEQLISPFKGPGFGMYDAPALLRDGHVLPPGDVTLALEHSKVPVLLGTNLDEFKLFMVGNPHYVSRFLGLRIKDEVAYERDSRFVTDVWRAMGVDAPVEAFRKAGAPVFAYRFDWADEPKSFFADVPKLLGAAHGLEIGFMFDDEDSEFDPFGVNTKENEAQRVKLARAMSSYWVQFARTGNPEQGVDGSLPTWEQAGAEHRFIVFDTDAKGGLRMEQGVLTLDSVEDAMWKNPAFTSDPALCQRAKGVFKDFAGEVGAWTAEREKRFAERCPKH